MQLIHPLTLPPRRPLPLHPSLAPSVTIQTTTSTTSDEVLHQQETETADPKVVLHTARANRMEINLDPPPQEVWGCCICV